jgi:hypothetical protein
VNILLILDLDPFGWVPNIQIQKTGAEAGFYAEISARF